LYFWANVKQFTAKMHLFYYIKTCDTSNRILKQLPTEKFKIIDIKKQSLTVKQLEKLVKLSGSYEALFSRRAKLYKEMDLKNQDLTEADYKRLILDEYTFLKRPVVVIDRKIFIGSEKKTVEKLISFVKNQMK
jgi:arsenate reductase